MPNEEAVLTTKVYDLKLKTPQQPWRIELTGDIHHGVNNHHASGYRRFCADCTKRHNAGLPFAVIYTGDEQDSASGSERMKLDAADLHGGTKQTFDEIMAERCMEVVAMNRPFASHVVGMIQGNHFWRFQTNNPKSGYREGMTSTEFICHKLGVNWLGFMSCVIIRTTTTVGICHNYGVVVCHGKTSCATAGGSINQVQNLRKIWPLADCYCLAHDHKLLAIKEPQLYVDDSAARRDGDLSVDNPEHLRVKSKAQIMCRSGSQLKSYEPGVPSYSVGRVYHPSALGSVTINVKCVRCQKNDRRTLVWEHTATI